MIQMTPLSGKLNKCWADIDTFVGNMQDFGPVQEYQNPISLKVENFYADFAQKHVHDGVRLC